MLPDNIGNGVCVTLHHVDAEEFRCAATLYGAKKVVWCVTYVHTFIVTLSYVSDSVFWLRSADPGT